MPTSLEDILLQSSGCSPWRPVAVVSTETDWEYLHKGWLIGFSRMTKRVRDKNIKCFCYSGRLWLISIWDHSKHIPLSWLPVRSRRQLLLCPLFMSPMFLCVTAKLQPRRARILTCFPFRGWMNLKDHHLFTEETSPLGPTDRTLIDIVFEPFAASDQWDHTIEFATDTKICTRGCSLSSHLEEVITSSTPPYTSILHI